MERPYLRVNSWARQSKRNARAHEKQTSQPIKSPYGVGRYCNLAVSPTRSHLLRKGGKLLNQQNSYPDFLETADENGEPNPTGENNIVRNLRSELSQIQTHHVEAVNELEKTRSLLRVQATINQEQKMEAETLQQRLFQIKAEFQSQIGEYKKLLDMRAARIHKCK